MNRKLLSAAIACMTLAPHYAMAQSGKTIIKSGTPIEVQSLKTIYAKDMEIGDNVDFKTISDIRQNGRTVVPAGTIVKGVVTEAKKSSLAGTKGRLAIDFKKLIMSNGEQVPLSGNVRISGKNKTPLAVITGLLIWPCIFIPGTKAVLPEGHNATATVLSNTEVGIE